MKRNFITLFLILCPLILWAGGSLPYRYSYLWDVTYSMHGGLSGSKYDSKNVKLAGKSTEIKQYNNKYDIYDYVMNSLIDDIKRIDLDPEGEIVIVPFDSEIVDVWRAKTTKDGIKTLVDKIQKFNYLEQKNTFLSVPLQYTLDRIITKDKFDVIKLMTDGKDNAQDTAAYYKLLQEWCERTTDMNAKGFYIMLTEKALDKKASSIIDTICNMDAVDPHFDIDFVQISFKDVNVSVDKDFDKEVSVPIEVRVNEQIPTGMRVRLKATENCYLNFDTVVTLDGSNIVKIRPMYKMDQGELHAALAFCDVTSKSVSIKIDKEGDNNNAQIVTPSFNITLINSSIKKLNLHVREK